MLRRGVCDAVDLRMAAELTLLAVKLLPPVTVPKVARPRLVRRLRENALTPLTLVCAPVGWGKTSLLASWVHDPGERRGVAWVSLDSNDDEPTRFWRYLVAAVRRVIPDVGGVAAGALEVPGVDPIATAIPALLNDLAAVDDHAVLVLDDYHVVTDPLIHEAMEYLVTYLPPVLRVVLATRHDPPLPLARLRARGQLTELRAADLRFDVDEVVSLLGGALGRPVTHDAATDLTARTEGWPAAVHLAGLAVRHEEDPVRQLALLPDDHRDLTDFLVSELLDGLDAAVEDALVRTSILERLCVSLCSTVLGAVMEPNWLTQLESSGMPIVALDRRRTWYRLHPVVGRVLSQRLRERHSGEAVAALHGRAAEWFADHGDDELAIGHLLAGGHYPKAAERLLDSLPKFGRRGESASYARLGNQLPMELVRADLRLAVTLAWGNGLSGEHQRARELIEVVAEMNDGCGPAPPNWRSVTSAAAALQVAFLYTTDSHELYRLATVATDLEDDPALPGYAIARATLGMAHMAKGDPASAIPALEAALASGLDALPAGNLITAGLLAENKLLAGDTEGAQLLLDRWLPQLDALEASVGEASAPATTTLCLAAGTLARQRGDLARAAAELERAVAAGRVFGVAPPLCDALAGLAEVRQLERNHDAARVLAREAHELAESSTVPADTVIRLQVLDRFLGRAAERTARRSGALVEELTDRELSILRAMQGDLSLRELGAELYLSLNTVKGYVRNLYRKLDVHTRADAIVRGRELGLL